MGINTIVFIHTLPTSTKKMLNQSDFIAELEFLTPEQGGRKNYVVSGYRPNIEFENYPERETCGQQTYIGTDFVLTGETVIAEIGILSVEYFVKRLYINMKFTFKEGARTVGYGKILEITNQTLNCEPNIKQEYINLNLYPIDIIKRIKIDFKDNFIVAFSQIQELIILDKSFRNHRIVRAIVYLGNKDLIHLEEVIKQAKVDYKDTLFLSEYIKKKRVRDFDNEFGKEEIIACR